jgi:hypothetical protein
MHSTLLRYALVATLLSTLAACGGSSSEGSSSDSVSGSSGSSVSSSSSASGSSASGNSASADPLVALSSNTYSVNAASNAVVTINRSGPSSGTASVSYTTLNGSAMAGMDYVATSGTVTWTDGDSSAKTVYIPVTSGASGKTFALSLVGISGQASFGEPLAATIAVAAVHSGSSSGSAPVKGFSGSSSGGSSSSGTAGASSSGTTGSSSSGVSRPSSSGTAGASSSGTTGSSSSGVSRPSSSGTAGASSSGTTGSSSSGVTHPSSSGTTGSSSSGAAGASSSGTPSSSSSSGSGSAFQLSAHTSAGSVSPGKSVTLTVDLTAATAQSNMIVNLEIHNSSGTKVAQSYMSSQNFAAHQTIPYTWAYTVPANTAAGSYVLEVGVFTANWAALSFFSASASSFTVTSASSAGPTSSAPAPAPSSNPSSPKTALLSYLKSLAGKTGPHILIGQHTNYWDSVPTDDLTGLYQQTGKNPAIVGVMLNSGSSIEGSAGSSYSGVTLANTYLSEGYIVLITEVPGSPLDGASMWNQNPMPTTPMPAANFANVTTPGTAEYDAFQNYLQQLATTLKQINGPVLFRPYAEQNGSWFWYGTQNPSQFIAMWQMMHDYLANAGVNNVLYVYATNSGVGNYAAYYPGAAYVDVVAEDAYPPTLNDAAVWSALAQVAPNAPQIYAEQGSNPNESSSVTPTDSYDNETYIQLIEQNFPNVVGIVKWCQADALDNQNGAATVMSDPQIITQELLPSSL